MVNVQTEDHPLLIYGWAYLRQSSKFYEFEVNRRFAYLYEMQYYLWKASE